MPDRRRSSRLVISDMTEGCLRLMHDVHVTGASAGHILADSDVPVPVGESVALELARDLDVRSFLRMRVDTSTVIHTGGIRRHRLALAQLQPTDAAPGGHSAREAGDRALARTVVPAIGVLVRRLQVRIRDVSASGCQLESRDGLPENSVGLLELAGSDGHQTEPLRVLRSRFLPGSVLPWRSGAQFLGLRAPTTSSLRNLAARFEIADELALSEDWTSYGFVAGIDRG